MVATNYQHVADGALGRVELGGGVYRIEWFEQTCEAHWTPLFYVCPSTWVAKTTEDQRAAAEEWALELADTGPMLVSARPEGRN